MILRIIYTTFYCLLLFALSVLLTARSGGPAAELGQGYTGAPGEVGTTCATCHGLNANYGLVTILAQALPEYSPTEVNDYQFLVSNTAGFPFGYGFQATIVDAATGDPVDLTYTNISSNLQVTTLPDGRKYVEHDGISGTNIFTFSFLPNYPSGGDAPAQINIHYAATVVNSNGMNSGDSGSLGNLLTQDRSNFLPVVLADFKARPIRKGIQLNWTTETEQNSDYFVVEHAANGIDFQPIETVNASGDSQIRQTYTYTHAEPVNGNNYYRLTMVDFDGKTVYSHVVVERFSSTDGGATVFPNPAHTQTEVYLTAFANERGTLEVYDLSGRLIHTNTLQLTQGDNYFNINCNDWMPNHYFVRISGEQFGEELIQMVKK